ncbi:lytic transglycosylase domain-containing protein [Paenibacillus sp. JX-17]|uniref:Lytic transglycosylase domain-containing protein n=1 Tax=Paenibacillus lacisoli TaxID=3064525 RepID=A0ABT9CA08_9BACL|nr:lytic transglycosylase domain-containing protein [Paenibacillus sp. JX-17]MDO7906092.1 lytic transglycosylase domain-containing protein [Paenibacillus sp. JX-17]
MKVLRKKRILLPVFVAIVLLLFLSTNWMSWFYPIHYKEEIRQSAEKYEVDPFLVASIIRVETNYKVSKESRRGALGLMQLMPDTAEWIMESAKLPRVPLDNIKHEPEMNIELGTWYLRKLSKQFGGNQTAVIAAYNAGPGNVDGWIKRGIWDGQSGTVKNIPIGETRHYVQRVIYYYNQYRDIYDEF